MYICLHISMFLHFTIIARGPVATSRAELKSSWHFGFILLFYNVYAVNNR